MEGQLKERIGMSSDFHNIKLLSSNIIDMLLTPQRMFFNKNIYSYKLGDESYNLAG